MNPSYPLYVVSKGRWKTRLTSRALEEMRVDYSIVVEPQEFDEYASVIDPKRIIPLPFSNLGQGSIPARNWIWEHAIQSGSRRHWILDDNIGSFRRMNRNAQIKVSSGTIFKIAEEFVDRYDNIALSGFQYDFFLPSKYWFPPLLFNTRIYSCILVNNELPHRWRGRYNEDTDLSLRVLKDGWCTVLFNAFIQEKKESMAMAGENTDELYAGDGRKLMAESLRDQHPDVVTVTKKYGRWQHSVNYRSFRKKNKLRLIGERPTGVNEYGMVVVQSPKHSSLSAARV